MGGLICDVPPPGVCAECLHEWNFFVSVGAPVFFYVKTIRQKNYKKRQEHQLEHSHIISRSNMTENISSHRCRRTQTPGGTSRKLIHPFSDARQFRKTPQENTTEKTTQAAARNFGATLFWLFVASSGCDADRAGKHEVRRRL